MELSGRALLSMYEALDLIPNTAKNKNKTEKMKNMCVYMYTHICTHIYLHALTHTGGLFWHTYVKISRIHSLLLLNKSTETYPFFKH